MMKRKQVTAENKIRRKWVEDERKERKKER
jgi:hypothetical protein